jgi:predicted glutamine amidotransferase
MCRLASWAGRDVATPTDALGNDAIERFAYLSTVHKDGWGVAWIDAAGQLQTHRSVRAAHTDPDFRTFATQTPARACILHARFRTPGYGEGLSNQHPFARQGWAFVHNGAILPKDRIERLTLPNGPKRQGDTDSEIYFLALLHELDHGEAFAQAASVVVARVAAERMHASSLNAMLLSETTLAVVSEYDPAVGAGSVRVWPDDEQASSIVWPALHPMLCTVRDDLVAVVSSGIVADPDAAGWAAMDNHTTWTVDLATLTVHQQAIDPAAPRPVAS